MEKVKVTLTSGNVVEKPLVTAFKGNAGVYTVLDNEMNGTMGLPIILVSKLEGNVLNAVPEKEWNAVKENLRLIIAGNQVDYVQVGADLTGPDAFFKQLTLPVASFEALKANYKVAVPEVPVQETAVEQPVAPQVEMPTEVVPTPQVVEAPVVPEPVVTPEVAPVEPVMPEVPVQEVVAEQPVTPQVEPIPEAVPTNDVPIDFTADKEAFLKACENMFDALVAKYRK